LFPRPERQRWWLATNKSTERVKESSSGCHRIGEKELKKLGGCKDRGEDTNSRGSEDSSQNWGLCSSRSRKERWLAAIWRKWLHVDRGCGICKGSLGGTVKRVGRSSGVGGLDV